MSQAAALYEPRVEETGRARPPVIAVTSGKGGVGKSSLVANLAALIAAGGNRVLLVDADYGLANLAVILGVAPGSTIADALAGRCTLADTLVEARPGVSLVPGGSGVRRMAAVSRSACLALVNGTRVLSSQFDLVLVDTAAGISPAVLTTLGQVDRVIVVLGDDPATFIDAYAVVKLVLEEGADKDVGLLVNRARGNSQGVRLAESFSLVTQRFLGRTPELLGVVPHDDRFGTATRKQRLIAVEEPGAPSAQALAELARRLEASSQRAACGEPMAATV